MHQTKRTFSLFLFLFLFLFGCASSTTVKTPVQVLFVGNSITYYHGVPYLFSVVSSELYNTDVKVDFLVQPGGHLSEVVANEEVLNELRGKDYDVVILQEWGGQLLCAADEENRVSRSCRTSLEAHRLLGEVSSNSSATRVLLGTYQPNTQVARALLLGEKQFFQALEFDKHVEVAPLLLVGESELSKLDWRADDGVHPGSALSLAIAFATAETVFGPVAADSGAINVYRTLERPKRSFSYEEIENDLSLFYDDFGTTYESDMLRSVSELAKSAELEGLSNGR